MKAQFDDNLAIPPAPGGQISQLRLTIRAMNPGQSFMVETEKERDAALAAGQRDGLTIVTRKINGSGFRIWKTSDLPSRRHIGKPRKTA